MELDKKCIQILKHILLEGDVLIYEQIKVLTHFSDDDIMERLVYLWKNEYIRILASEQPKLLPMDGDFQITTKGKLYLEALTKKNHTNRMEWLRYGVTTLIAVAALINSILARLGY